MDKEEAQNPATGVRKGLLGVSLKLSPEDKWANLAEEREALQKKPIDQRGHESTWVESIWVISTVILLKVL